MDELILTKSNASVFELVSRSHTGYLEYPGHWIESATESTSVDRRHFDFVYRSAAPVELAKPKWTIAPRRCPRHAQWLVHAVRGMQPDVLSCEVSYRHFRAISSSWKYPRGQLERPNKRDYVRDDELMTWMEVIKLSEQEALANDLASKLAARDHEVKAIAAKLTGQEAKLRDVLSSNSWQITDPIRRSSYLFSRIGNFLRITIKLLWRKFTLKLHQKLGRHHPS